VLRRLVLTRSAEAEAEGRPDLRPDQGATMAASMLAYDPVDALTHDQHLTLLRFLCDAALESERMRGVLQRAWGRGREPGREPGREGRVEDMRRRALNPRFTCLWHAHHPASLRPVLQAARTKR
jgi:hypothetical protein